jgi:transcriptional regulator with XRE-family HTH domain
MPGRPPELSSYDDHVRRGLSIIGRAIYEERRRTGVTRRQLGRLVGTHQSTISRLECGRLTGLRLTRLAAIVSALEELSFRAR